ncbi:hypothetical protein K435DRAFT_468801 [Dendrothele bispora CBS 962.96]|nr:hypothetical protein K435DRAFT_468801 [Dendrothele bispora CBS 962.96]
MSSITNPSIDFNIAETTEDWAIKGHVNKNTSARTSSGNLSNVARHAKRNLDNK